MKCLKIEDNKGLYSTNGVDWKEIDKIDKDDLLKIIDLILSEDEIEMDEFNDDFLCNQAHKIIYKSIYSKLFQLHQDKTTITDQDQDLYKEAFEKYSSKIKQD